MIRALAYRFARDAPADAPDLAWEDVAQEASRRFFSRGVHQFRGEGAEWSYISVIVRSSWIQLARRSVRRRRWTERFGRELRPENVQASEYLEAEDILARVSDRCRDLLARVYLDGESYTGLAEELGLKESSVRARVSRCLDEARKRAGPATGSTPSGREGEGRDPSRRR